MFVFQQNSWTESVRCSHSHFSKVYVGFSFNLVGEFQKLREHPCQRTQWFVSYGSAVQTSGFIICTIHWHSEYSACSNCTAQVTDTELLWTITSLSHIGSIHSLNIVYPALFLFFKNICLRASSSNEKRNQW